MTINDYQCYECHILIILAGILYYSLMMLMMLMMMMMMILSNIKLKKTSKWLGNSKCSPSFQYCWEHGNNYP